LIQKTLGERHKGDGDDAEFFERVFQPIDFDPAVEHVVAGLMNKAGRAKVIGGGYGLAGLFFEL